MLGIFKLHKFNLHRFFFQVWELLQHTVIFSRVKLVGIQESRKPAFRGTKFPKRENLALDRNQTGELKASAPIEPIRLAHGLGS